MKAPLPARTLPAALIAMALLAGCGGSTPPEPPPPAKPIVLGVFGGYPPNMLRVRITPEGEGMVVARGSLRSGGPVEKLGPPKRGHFILSPEELTKLNSNLAGAGVGDLDPGPQTCADCLVYRLAYGGERFESDMLTIPAELEGSIRRIEDLAGEALSGKGSGSR